jgi:hypothetical protein
MTADEQRPSTQDQATEPAKRFVWWSTDKSVADGTPSVLAALEVVVAVGVYWAIAIYFETTTHLWVSICVAPLLLLRSEQSIALGAQWFGSYVRRRDELDKRDVRTLLQSVEVWAWIATGLIASALVSHLLAREWLVGHESWSLYWRTAMVEYVAGAIVGAVVVAGAGAGADVGAVVGAVVVAGAGAGAVAVAGVVAGAGAVVVAGALALALAFTLVGVGAGAVAPVVGRAVLVAVFGPGYLLGVWLRTVAIRFAATARFLRSGFWDIPTNFRQTLLVVDLRHPAELVPGYSGRFANTTTEAFRNVAGGDLLVRLVIVVGYVVFFVPAYVYRLSIKSTCWLYLPLVYIASERDLAATPSHFVDRLIRGGWEWWRRILAVLTLIAFALTTLASISAQELAGFFMHRTISPKIISPLEFMFQFDFSGKWWQYCSLAGALITGLLFLQAKEMRVDIDYAHNAQAQTTVARQVNRVKLMMRVRNVLSMALILMIVVHALLSFSPIGPYLPAYILRGLGWFYGAYMPAIPTMP